jgi:CRISPR-associated protein (TIGR02710 family)
MTDVLIVTLGTSPDPIINCISSLRPDRTVFVCSVESQKLVETVSANVQLPDFNSGRDVVVLRQRLRGKRPGQDEVNEIDQLDRVYQRAHELFAQVRHENPGCRIIADYSGGTKTMTTGLAMAAIDDGHVKLHLTISDRSPGQPTLSGYSSPVAVSTAAIHARRLRERELPPLLKRFDYEAARQAVRRVQTLDNQDLVTTSWLQGLETLLVSLDAWDRFDHGKALEVLQGLNDRRFDQLLLFPLKRVIGSRRLVDEKDAEAERWAQIKGHGLEAVEDLLRNAERRAAQQRYDDAVGRLYRALELTAQLLLKTGVRGKVGPAGLDTSKVDVDKLPPEIQARFAEEQKQPPVKVGLSEAWDLLADLGHPAGILWRERRSQLHEKLEVRNLSLFAHGFTPVTYESWRQMEVVVVQFLKQVVSEQPRYTDASALPQLPQSLVELEPGQSVPPASAKPS